MYIPREVEGTIDSMLAQGKVVLVTGARQVGKTTVLREHLGSAFDYVSLENPIDYTAARTDALLFFEGPRHATHHRRSAARPRAVRHRQVPRGPVRQARPKVFETFVVSEVLESYMNAGANPRDVWFYRDQKKREIDPVIQRGHVLHPVEITTGVRIGVDATKSFSCLEDMPDHELGKRSQRPLPAP